MDNTRSGHIPPDFQFARFRLGDFEFGIEVRKVKEIIRLRRPVRTVECPPFLEGFIRLRNIGVPVVDLRKRFSLPAPESEHARIIIISVEGLIAGLVVDEVNDVTAGGAVIAKALLSSEPWSSCLEAVVESQGTMVRIIDPSMLLTHDEKMYLCAPLTKDQGR